LDVAYTCEWEAQVTDFLTGEIRLFSPSTEGITIDLHDKVAGTTATCTLKESVHDIERRTTGVKARKLSGACWYDGGMPMAFEANCFQPASGKGWYDPAGIMIWSPTRQAFAKGLKVGVKEDPSFK